MKKSLKLIMIVATLLIGEMTISSCAQKNSLDDSSKDQNTSVTNSSIDESNKTLNSKGKEAVLDSLSQIHARLEKLDLKISEQRTEIDNIKSALEGLKKNGSISILVAWGGAVVSMVIAALALIKANSAITRVGRQSQKIETLNRSLAESEARFMNVSRNKDISASSIADRAYKELSFRLYKIERQLEYQSQQTLAETRIDNPIVVSDTSSSEQYGYFGLPSKMSETEAYFKRLDKSRDSEARFSVVVRDERAEFRPLEGKQYFNDMKSSDTIKMALDIQGCAPSDAIQMTVIKPGEAKLVEGLWVITKNAIIVLSR